MRAVGVLLVLLGAMAMAAIPLRQANSKTSVYDYANILDDQQQANLNQRLQQVYQETNREVVVIIVSSMSSYGPPNVEVLARQWFDQWHLASQDILFLVSLGDRKARIQLGSGWPKKWDGHCRRVMEGDIVPAFKAEAYARGIEAGCNRLMEMETTGPGATPPAMPLMERVTEQTNAMFAMSDIPRPYAIALIGLGLALIVGGFVFSQASSTRLLFSALGIFVIVVALCTMVIYALLVLAFLMLPRGSGRRGYGYHSHSSYDSGGSSDFSWGGGGGGYFGGGGDSGGGATGSW